MCRATKNHLTSLIATTRLRTNKQTKKNIKSQEKEEEAAAKKRMQNEKQKWIQFHCPQ